MILNEGRVLWLETIYLPSDLLACPEASDHPASSLFEGSAELVNAETLFKAVSEGQGRQNFPADKRHLLAFSKLPTSIGERGNKL
jgi:hypothetical protein